MTPLASAAAAPAGSGLTSMLLLALPLVLLVFLMFNQRRRSRQLVEAQSALAVGDEVMTTAGLYGRVAILEESVVHLEIAPGVVVKVDRRAMVPGVTHPGTTHPGTTQPGGASGPGATPEDRA